MSGRRFWVLLVLAAVFAMHGVQCTAGMSSPGIGDHAPSAGVAVAAVDAGGGLGPHADVAGTSRTGHDSSAPASSGHLQALCLTVLAAAVAVLVVLLGDRACGLLLLPRWLPVLPRPGWTRPPRPPDLHTLCLLRT